MICKTKCIYRLLPSLFAVVAMVSLVMAPAAARDMAEITKTKQFNIGVVPFPPDVIKDPITGEYKGIFVDAARYICETIEVECVFKEFAWATFIAGLQSRQIDLSVASTYSKMKRALVVNFSQPIYFLGYRAVAKKGDTRFNSPEDLNNPGITIGVTQGTGEHDWVQKVAPKAKLSVVKTEEMNMLQIVTGKVDVAIGDSVAAHHALAKQSGIEAVLGGRIYSRNMVAWAMHKEDTDILRFVNTALNQLIASGKLEDLAKAYEAPWINDLAF